MVQNEEKKSHSAQSGLNSYVFSTFVGIIWDQFFLLITDSRYSHVPGDKGGPFFFRLQNFFRCSFYVQIGVLHFVSRVQFYAILSNFYAKLNVSNLYVMNLY
jgi:hypothetical protein